MWYNTIQTNDDDLSFVCQGSPTYRGNTGTSNVPISTRDDGTISTNNVTSLSTTQPTGSAPTETKNRDDKGNISDEKEGVSDGKTNDGNNGETSRVICTQVL